MRSLTLALVTSISLLPRVASAQWQPNGAPLSTALYNQEGPAIVSDGAGGAIVSWHDFRLGTFYNIYAQRIDAAGIPLWVADGVLICNATFDQLATQIVSDGAGGAIITWQDQRTGTTDIYAQRVNASGISQWTANGVALCTAGNAQDAPAIVSDGAGGAIVSWQDFRLGTFYNIFTQRVDAAGTPLWVADGVLICNATFDQLATQIVSDGAGGAIITWQDQRTGNIDIYAQRMNPSGISQWTANGVALCTAANAQIAPEVVSDGTGGAIVAWSDHRSGTDDDVYAQRVNAAGTSQWIANGVSVCAAALDQFSPTVASDGAGGAILAWYDSRSGSSGTYAQRVSSAGGPLWTFNGVALCTASSGPSTPTIASDGAGGAVVAWQDTRNGMNDIYAQRVNGVGTPQWTPDGVVLCAAALDQTAATISSDGNGGMIVAWEDNRSGFNDVYAQRVEPAEGFWGHPEPTVSSVADIPGDQGGKVKVNWNASGWDVRHYDTITHYSIWRATETYPLVGASAQSGTDPSKIRKDFAGEAYWVQQSPTTTYYWEWVGNQDILYSPAYTFSASTRSDSTSQGAADHFFQVVSHTADPFVFWPSNAMSGHSVDNLAPAAPLMLTAQRVGADVLLRWNRVRVPDLRDYSLYRATSTGVTPLPINFFASSEDTVLIDASAPTSALYYIVTAFDVHENQSTPSNEASVGATTSIGNAPPITALTALDNVPNPFAGTTTLRVGLPQASEVEIDVFDVAGRVVSSERTSLLAAGWREIPFDGRSAGGKLLTSGVYFYRVKAAGATITRKMVIAR